MITKTQQVAAAKDFAQFWQGKGYEKGESQPFWLALLRDVFGIAQPESIVQFESKANIDHRGFIDIVIPSAAVLIEQKSLDIDLKKPIRQSDGTLLTPFQQAQRYLLEIPKSKQPRWVVTCNFRSFLVYDREHPNRDPEEILLENLPTEYYRLNFLVDQGDERIKREMEVSIAAGEIVGRFYDAFAKQYIDPTTEEALKSLNVLCVRLVFCMYADDAGIFGKKGMFHSYMQSFEPRHMRKALIELFDVLDTKMSDRDPYMDEALASFPYVNGGLFDEKDIEIPQFTQEIKDLLIHNASDDFNWADISPTIFGAVFESTLNPQTRRTGGMHYTSIENIHKVIDPLFMNALEAELETIKAIKTAKNKMDNLKKFQEKLAELTFLDPACGSGNFLTETYITLRRLENEILRIFYGEQILMDIIADHPIKVNISQFYGIEINDFATTVARTALWIAESQMMQETMEIINTNLDFLPLQSYANITQGNALRLNWEDTIPKHKLSYIMGNPPFVGARLMNTTQKDEINHIFGKLKGVGNLDYVTAWFKKAADMMQGTNIRAALVVTNSISQGEQPAILWKPLLKKGGGGCISTLVCLALFGIAKQQVRRQFIA